MRIKYRSKREGLNGRFYQADAVDFLRSNDGVDADLIFLDPPFNLGKKYPGREPHHDQLPDTEYEEKIRFVIDAAVDALKPGGALYLYHIPKWAIRFSRYLDERLMFRHWIAVAMKNGFVRGPNLYPAHYSLLYFTKGTANVFHRPKLELQRCRKCNATVKDYGGYLTIMEEKGVNLSDIWDDLSPVRHRSTKTRDANELPVEFYRRIFQISGVRGGLFLDPFVGSGASVIGALESEMHYTVNDISALTLEQALSRVRNTDLEDVCVRNHG